MIKLFNYSILSNIIIILLFLIPASASGIKVVVTMLPIHSLVAGIMVGVGKPLLLIKGGQSPHTYVMKPSSVRMLNEAKIIFWVGPNLESFLVKPLAALSNEIRLIELAGIKNSHSRDLLYKGKVSPVIKYDRDHNSSDPHIWLDPRIAINLVKSITNALSLVDNTNEELYRKNAGLILTQLALLDAEIQTALSPVSSIPYMVFHDAYGHFQERYGLSFHGSVALDISRSAGARRLSMLRHRIVDRKVVCVFRDAQFNSSLAKVLIEGTSAKLGILDPLGFGLKPGPSLYSSLMRNLARSFIDCLGGKKLKNG
jgi:zinc transport system substrate-binding protein